MRVGVLTGGGDCPGLNAVIRAVVRRGVAEYDYEFLGFRDGWRGPLDNLTMDLGVPQVRGILPRGGTILGSSRTNPFKVDQGVERIKDNLQANGVDALVANVQRQTTFRRRGGIVGLNIGKNADTPIERALDDYRIGLQKVYAHADYVAVNISSPNTKDLRSLQGTRELTGLLAGLRDERMLHVARRSVAVAGMPRCIAGVPAALRARPTPTLAREPLLLRSGGVRAALAVVATLVGCGSNVAADDGGLAESEAWADAPVLQQAWQRGPIYQTVRARLAAGTPLKTLKDALSKDTRFSVDVTTEKQFYADQQKAMSNIIRRVGFWIAIIMGLAALFAALNTLESAVANRVREIATLRAMGFGAGPVVTSVLVEAMILGAIGGLLGGLCAYLFLNGITSSTLNFASFSQITYAFTVTPLLMLLGIGYGLLLCLLAGILPGIRAAKQPITQGLREL